MRSRFFFVDSIEFGGLMTIVLTFHAFSITKRLPPFKAAFGMADNDRYLPIMAIIAAIFGR
jgi:hypothetical protein